MAIEYRRGRPYYYRKVREGERVRSIYVGGGDLLTAQGLHAADNADRTRRAEAWATSGIDGASAELVRSQEDHRRVMALVREILEASGYHRPQRGQWRRKRN